MTIQAVTKQPKLTVFSKTRVIRLRQLLENNLLHIFDSVRSNFGNTDPIANTAIYNLESMVIVDRKLQRKGGKRVEVDTLLAVLVGQDLWEQRISANPLAVPYIEEFVLLDDFLLAQDRLARSLSRVTPIVERRTVTLRVPMGLTHTLAPYLAGTVMASLVANPPVETAPNAGTITFDVGDVGVETTVSYLTQTLYPVMRVETAKRQPVSVDNVFEGIQAYILSEELAGLLSITLP